MAPLHIGIAACSAEGAALCYRTICTEAPAILGTHHHPEDRELKRPVTVRLSKGPPGRSKPAAGNCTSPPESGSTVTLAPSVPRGSGSLSGLGSA